MAILTTERLFLFLLFIAATISLSGYDPDVYLHLTTGRHLLSTGELPHIDVFSFTRQGEPWVMHEWLYQIFLYSLHQAFGATGLKIFGAAILTAILYFNKKNCEIVKAWNFAAWVTTLILFIAWIKFIGLRPHIITFLFFVLTLRFILLYRYQQQHRALYLIPVMMLLWVNSHGGFIIGIVLLGYMTLLTLIENRLNDKRPPWHLMKVLLLTVLASAVNPYGLEQLLFPFQLIEQWIMEYVTEWQSPSLSEWNIIIYLLIIGAFVLMSPLIPRNDRRFQLLFVTPFILASFEAVRHLPLAAFIIAPFFAAQLTRLISARSQSRQHAGVLRTELGKTEYVLNWLVLLAFCVTLYWIYPALNKQASNTFNKRFPTGATQYLIEHNIRGRMFTTLEYSDYILFHRYPEQKVFYDVRFEIYGEEIARDYLRMLNAAEGWQQLFKKYAIAFSVIDKSKPIYGAIAKDSDFMLLYEDAHSAIFYCHSTNLVNSASMASLRSCE